jgi:hypothetical protein
MIEMKGIVPAALLLLGGGSEIWAAQPSSNPPANSAAVATAAHPAFQPFPHGAPDAGKSLQKLDSEQTKRLARKLELRVSELSSQLAQQKAKVDQATIADEANIAASGFPAPDALSKVYGILWEYHKTSAPLILEMSILSLRLQTYKETGDLPVDVPNREELKRYIDDPWKNFVYHGGPVTLLNTDVSVLIKQVRQYDRLFPVAGRLNKSAVARKVPVPPERTANPPRENSSAHVYASYGKKSKTPAPERPLVPDLIDLLSSKEPRRRALAADELENLGKAAAPAVSALRAALSDPDSRVRASAVLALSGVPGLGNDIVADIRRALGDKSEDVRFSAQAALERLGAKTKE